MLEIDELAADAVASIKKQKITLNEIVSLGKLLEEAAEDVVFAEQSLVEKKEIYNNLATKLLPEAMLQLGLKNFTLADGVIVEMKDIIAVKITEENKQEAYQWLRDKGHGDLIKNEVKVTFGKDEDNDAKKLVSWLELDAGINFSSLEKNEKVHSKTLEAFVRDYLKTGEKFPSELFKLYTGNIVTLQLTRKRS